MASFRYLPLEDSAQEIRLLSLLEGDFSSEVRILICNIPLAAENPPVYEALSYTWGSTENPVNISVGEVPGVATLAVTQNLAQALPYLRYENRPRILWIDSVCVNQNDLQERSQQVERMGDIYRLADRVIAWIGPRDEDTTYGLRLLSNLSSMIEVDWTKRTIRPATLEASHAGWADLTKRLPYGKKELLAILHLFDRPWFERLWIWGEIWSANRKVTLMCGADIMPWTAFRDAVWCLMKKTLGGGVPEPRKRVRFHDRLKLIYELCDDALPHKFERFLNKARSRMCSDPRDRVYALLSTFKGPAGIDIKTNYFKTTRQVYTDVFVWYFNFYHTLNILTECEMGEEPRQMPTWIPDWSIEHAAVDFLHPGQASGDVPAWVRFQEPGILFVKVIHSAEIKYAEKVKFDKGTFRESRSELRRLAPHGILHRSYMGGRSMLDAYCEAMVCGSWSENYQPPELTLPQQRQSRDVLIDLLQTEGTPDIGQESAARKLLGQFHTFGRNRSFIITEEGYIGLAPKMVCPGDRVSVVFGCHTPLVLRPCVNCEYYHVLGKCYVPGLMNGEALLGPLPSHYTPIYHYNEKSQSWDRVLLNRDNGHPESEDPRIRPLCFPDTPEGQRGEIDPSVMEKRGVKLRIIGLE